MKLSTRFQKLTLWNKLSVFGAIVSFLAFIFAIVFFLANLFSDKNSQESTNKIYDSVMEV